MRSSPNKISKMELRKELHLTRPPRLEGKAKNAGMDPVRKRKKTRPRASQKSKPQSYSAKQRKDYQLRSKRGGR